MKIKENQLYSINHCDRYKPCPALDFHYDWFDWLVKDVVENFEPLEGAENNGEVWVFYYSFWINKEQRLIIKKQKDSGEWIWYVSLVCKKNLMLYGSGINHIDERMNWHEKISLSSDDVNDAIKASAEEGLAVIKEAYEKIKADYDSYIKSLDKRAVSYRLRTGVIARRDYDALEFTLPENERDTVSKFLNDGKNIPLIEKCLEYISTPITPIQKITTRSFFEACRAYYQINPKVFKKQVLYKYGDHMRLTDAEVSPAEATARDWYCNYADGRDNGLRNVDEDSHEDFLEWEAGRGKYLFNGSHPWEIGGGQYLYIYEIKEGRTIFNKVKFTKTSGYALYFKWHTPFLETAVKGFIAMRDLGLPVALADSADMKLLLTKQDLVGVRETFERYADFSWAERLGTVVVKTSLPETNQRQYIKKITWKPISYNKKRNS